MKARGKRLWAVPLTLALAGAMFCPIPASAVSQEQESAQKNEEKPSLGEIARRLRKEKKPASKTAKVWTNDNLPQNPFPVINVIGAPPPAAEEAKAPAGEAKPQAVPAPPGGGPASLREAQTALEEAKKDLATAQTELDILQRQLVLDQQQFYSNPNYTDDSAGKARLDQLQSQIQAKEQDVQAQKDKVAALEAELEKLKAGSPQSEQGEPPANPEPNPPASPPPA